MRYRMPFCDAMNALAKEAPLALIYDHLEEFCIDCAMVQLKHVANGQELIFTDGPPSWIVAREERKAAAAAERAKAVEAARLREEAEEKRQTGGQDRKISWESTEEDKKAKLRELAGQRSDKHLEFEIRKTLKANDVQAAEMRLELKREIGLKKKEAEKEQNKVQAKAEIKAQKEEQKKNPNAPMEPNKYQKRPWQPSLMQSIAIGEARRSALNVEEQKRYTSIVANLHTLDKHVRFEQNKMDLRIYDERLKAERLIVAALVRERLEKENVSIKEVQKEVDIVLTRWQSRHVSDRRKFEPLKKIPWGREAGAVPKADGVFKPNLERLLMAAPNPKLALPATMQDRLPVAYDTYRFAPQAKRHTAIVNDNTLRTLCLDNSCTFAMDATTATHLMSRPGEPRNYGYIVPVTVCDQFRDGSIVRQCFLEKPRPQGGISNRTLLQMVAKYRVKSTFTNKAEVAQPKASRVSVASTSAKAAEEEKEEGSSTFSLIDNLLGSMASSSLPSPSVLATSTGGAASAKASPTTHSYGVFTIPSFSLTETRVLIRHSPCARNVSTGGTEYEVAAKVELACDAGVTKETFEETLWTSMKTTFKGAVNSATVHMHPYMKDALQISHSRAVPPGNHLNEGFFPLLSTRTEHLSKLLAELQQLQTGDYMLQVSPTSDVMTLYRENPRGTEMFIGKTPCRIPNSTLKAIDNFTGIDEKRVLHWQVMQGRPPLTLWPIMHFMLYTYVLAKQRQEKMGGGGQGGQKPQWKKQKADMTAEERKQFNFLSNQRKKENKQKRRSDEQAEQGPQMKKWKEEL